MAIHLCNKPMHLNLEPSHLRIISNLNRHIYKVGLINKKKRKVQKLVFPPRAAPPPRDKPPRVFVVWMMRPDVCCDCWGGCCCVGWICCCCSCCCCCSWALGMPRCTKRVWFASCCWDAGCICWLIKPGNWLEPASPLPIAPLKLELWNWKRLFCSRNWLDWKPAGPVDWPVICWLCICISCWK